MRPVNAQLRAPLLTPEQHNMLLNNGRINRQRRDAGLLEEDFSPVVKLFTPDSGGTWLLSEIDPEQPDIAFGLCDQGQGDPEVGNVSLAELAEVRGWTDLPIERDLYFTAMKTIAAYAEEAISAGRITA
jgi:hypothetical protein